ncbi:MULTISPECIES: GAF domain-containing protein [unclassified Coleofasciculus]|uniref:GAF domain-containing protein n=1 Tax=unclassified Coleofasciculus TaxID=2692782 RepID=UPI0018808F68|nr:MULTISPECIES: GAF domain-containing protein [unclassified Coleofasciculus]MBE9127741.1 GAF domain-containing protein [Coleofasciculus sp. LEGE 07081]MBE9150709.1 GAF domain-containing protein [Coleofasciculus sp. LEGE 07092]
MISKLSEQSNHPEGANSGLLIARALKEKSQNYKKLLVEVLRWTGGQPFLTHQLCKLIVDAQNSPSLGAEAEWVENLVRSRWIENWENCEELIHLRTIRDRLLRRKSRTIRLLKLYQRILEQGEATANDTSEQKELRMLGLVLKHQGKLRVHNRIYESIFNPEWVKNAINAIQSELEPTDSEFLKTLSELERKLLVSQVEILSKTDSEAEDHGSAQALYEVLRDVTSKVGELLGADRATIFLLNDEKTELWSLVAENEEGEFLDIQVRVGEGIAGQVAQTKKVIHIPHNVYEDPRAVLVKEFDKKYNYCTENILAFPILDEHQQLIAVIQLLNKLPGDNQPEIKGKGFTTLDLERLAKCVIPIRRILESCQSCYKVTKKLRATAALAEATRSLDQINLDTKAILQRVMNAAKKLMNADRSTLWLVDNDRGDLWTELPGKGEVRCGVGVGFVGQVAQSQKPMIIPFDLYDHPSAENAKKTDEQTRYRTCSLLCMPVVSPDGELLGITQLINKRKPGEHPEYNKEDWPLVPDYFKASFDKNDRQAMQVFNERVGVILQFVKTHETLKKLAQIEPKESVYNTLAILGNAVVDESDDALYNAIYYVLSFVNTSIRKLLVAQHTTIFLMDAEESELWSLVQGADETDAKEIRISASQGIAGKIVKSKSVKASNKPSKVNDVVIHIGIEPNLINNLQNLLLFPVVDRKGSIVAIIRSFNKLKFPIDPGVPLSTQINPHGFMQTDADHLRARTESMLPILQAFQAFHREIRTLREQRQAIDPLYQAISLVSKSSGGNAEEIIQTVMQAAKQLTNADRTTLWLIDYETKELWTKIPQADGSLIETRVPLGEGFAGKVAQTGQPLNISFDLYDHPDSEIARRTDEKTHYRTCSLLCLPVMSCDGELLAVTQLVNKRISGDFTEYNPAEWPDVPEYFRASFDEEDQRDMEIFNNQVAVVLPGIMG